LQAKREKNQLNKLLIELNDERFCFGGPMNSDQSEDDDVHFVRVRPAIADCFDR
jgi:hypothetical protein